jgi:hypothetical protein
MSSTVTTATVSIINSVAILGSLGLVVAVLLLLLLIKKEILTTSARPWVQNLTKVLNVAIVPLLMAFGLIVIINLLHNLK